MNKIEKYAKKYLSDKKLKEYQPLLCNETNCQIIPGIEDAFLLDAPVRALTFPFMREQELVDNALLIRYTIDYITLSRMEQNETFAMQVFSTLAGNALYSFHLKDFRQRKITAKRPSGTFILHFPDTAAVELRFYAESITNGEI